MPAVSIRNDMVARPYFVYEIADEGTIVYDVVSGRLTFPGGTEDFAEPTIPDEWYRDVPRLTSVYDWLFMLLNAAVCASGDDDFTIELVDVQNADGNSLTEALAILRGEWKHDPIPHASPHKFRTFEELQVAIGEREPPTEVLDGRRKRTLTAAWCGIEDLLSLETLHFRVTRVRAPDSTGTSSDRGHY